MKTVMQLLDGCTGAGENKKALGSVSWSRLHVLPVLVWVLSGLLASSPSPNICMLGYIEL